MADDLYDPPALAPGTLRVLPLGGLGEIGRNMTVYEFEGKLLVVDCGVLFPEEHQPARASAPRHPPVTGSAPN